MLYIPKLPIFYKNFENISKSAIPPNAIEFSSYSLPGLKEMLEKVAKEYPSDLLEGYYVVCPQYGRLDKFGSICFKDMQPTITGSPFIKEELQEAAIREMVEETGIRTTNFFPSVRQFFGRGRLVQNFLCHINGTSSLNKNETLSSKITMKNDDKNKKVQILAFGELSYLQKMLEDSLTPLESNDTKLSLNKDSIVGVRLVSLVDIMGWSQIVEKERRRV
jgi:hypothetical protein